jgi:beta-fructofuranosidase
MTRYTSRLSKNCKPCVANTNSSTNFQLADEARTLDGITGNALELKVNFCANDCRHFGVVVRATAEGDGCEIIYGRDAQCIGDVPFALDENEELNLHIFVDRSVVEVFINNRACFTTRTYPTSDEALGVRVLARGGVASVVSLDVWQFDGSETA